MGIDKRKEVAICFYKTQLNGKCVKMNLCVYVRTRPVNLTLQPHGGSSVHEIFQARILE